MILLNNKPINITMFPDNTSQVWKLDESLLKPGKLAKVEWKFSHEGEFLHLAQLKDLLDHNDMKSVLKIDYLPYGRQDKVIENNKTFGLVTFSKLLNGLNFSKITILDPHSERALALISNSDGVIPIEEILTIRSELEDPLLCYPDAGALDKYYRLFKYCRYTFGKKVRDQLTGDIISYELCEGRIKDSAVLIVDDICDGGATFVLLAKELIKKGAKEVNLFVSHGIFSKGTRILFDAGIKRIFTKEGEIFQREGTTQC